MPDSLRRAVGEVFARPEYQWVERRRPLQWLWNLWRSFLDWLNELADTHPLGFNALLWGAIVLLLLLLVHIGYVLWRIVQPSARTAQAPGGARAAIDDAATHLLRAAELAAAGRYAEALGHRFVALVLELERRDALRFHASKTPAEYVGELRLDDSRRARFAGLVGRLYRHLFGAVPCEATDYHAFAAEAESLTGRHVVPA